MHNSSISYTCKSSCSIELFFICFICCYYCLAQFLMSKQHKARYTNYTCFKGIVYRDRNDLRLYTQRVMLPDNPFLYFRKATAIT